MKKYLALFFALTCISYAQERPDIIIEDFESGTYDKWNIEGDCFGSAPIKGAFPRQSKIFQYEGEYLINTFKDGDKTTGKATLKTPFIAERNFLDVLVGGGAHTGKVYLRVLVDDEEIARVAGRESEVLLPKKISLEKHQGREVQIEIVDASTDGWGHINVDYIKLTDTALPSSKSVEVVADKRYVYIPVRNFASPTWVDIFDADDNTKLFWQEVNVDFENPDWVASVDLSKFAGRTLSIKFNGVSSVPDSLETGDELATPRSDAQELRPNFHFTAPQGWLNDPNGLFYRDGVWHLFYQSTPISVNGWMRHWGYATTEDFITWKDQPAAIHPIYKDGRTYSVWSGTAFADPENKSGLFKTDKGVIFAHTLTDSGEHLVYSEDMKTFTEIEGINPIITAFGRDPRIFYDEQKNHWVILRYEAIDASKPHSKENDAFVFYTSKDLKTWKRNPHILLGYYECPDMFQMKVENSGEHKYVIIEAEKRFTVIDFDGEDFELVQESRHMPLQGSIYAGQLFRHAPDGRHVGIWWLNSDTARYQNMPFSQQMTIPYDFKLVKDDDGSYRMKIYPAKEIEKAFSKSKNLLDEEIEIKGGKINVVKDKDFCLEMEFDMSNADVVILSFDGREYHYSPKHHALAGNPIGGEASDTFKAKVFVDKCAIEMFINDGDGNVVAAEILGNDDIQVAVGGHGAILKKAVLRKR